MRRAIKKLIKNMGFIKFIFDFDLIFLTTG